ncbi:hypothetical protein TNCV_4352081 [Trichonephila clavipes]|nr:hypothetical protein TNCV_4352081 [Trichonephila clavipes]
MRIMVKYWVANIESLRSTGLLTRKCLRLKNFSITRMTMYTQRYMPGKLKKKHCVQRGNHPASVMFWSSVRYEGISDSVLREITENHGKSLSRSYHRINKKAHECKLVQWKRLGFQQDSAPAYKEDYSMRIKN